MGVLARIAGLAAAALVAAVAALPGLGNAAPAINFELVGHEPLHNRGMNAAPALYDHTVYIGSRTDGSHPHAGVLVVDVANPAAPRVVNEIGPSDQALPSITSRELRVWPQQKLLLVMNFQCSAIIHACASPADVAGSLTREIAFYDITDQVNPKKIASYQPTRTPHEMFLWVDPVHAGRALLFMSTPTSSTTQPNLIITDISKARQGQFTEAVRWFGNDQFSEQLRTDNDVRLHSIGVSPDGTRTYLAYLGGGFLVLDTSEVAYALTDPKVRLVTPVAQRIPSFTKIGTHSAVKVPNKDLVLTTDEVYGKALDDVFGEHGCPWGWVGVIDVSDETRPKVVSEFRLAENQPAYCEGAAGQDPQNTYFTSYASHNPTLVGDLAFVTWHSNGLRAISLANPASPAQVGVFMPEPLSYVVTEDPALSMGTSKVVAWSYPIIKDGLIYMVDLRNGLYVLRYTGPGASDVNAVRFIEGNSNLGDGGVPETFVLGNKKVPAGKVASDRLPSTGTSSGAVIFAGVALLLAAAALSHRIGMFGSLTKRGISR